MNKTFLKKGVASVLSLIMVFTAAIPSSIAYADEAGVVSQISHDYVATLGQTANGNVSFVSDGNKTQDPTTYTQGDKVEVAVEPEDGFNTAKVEIIDTDGIVVATLENGLVTETDGMYYFEMPDSNITINVAFEAEPVETETETETEAATEETTESETAATETETEVEATETEIESETATTDTEATVEATENENESETATTETETTVEATDTEIAVETTEVETTTEVESEKETEQTTEAATEEVKIQIFEEFLEK